MADLGASPAPAVNVVLGVCEAEEELVPGVPQVAELPDLLVGVPRFSEIPDMGTGVAESAEALPVPVAGSVALAREIFEPAQEEAAAAAAPPPMPAQAPSSEPPKSALGSSLLAPAKAASSAAAGEDEFEIAQDFTSEPLDARLGSKDINRRCSAYGELQASMETGASSHPFVTLWQHLDVCIGETLPKAQDAALSALCKYLELCPDVDGSTVLPLVRRLLEHKSIDKPKMQQLVPPVLMLVTEICSGPTVVKEMLDCLAHLESSTKKVQGFFKKQVAFILRLFSMLLAEFGAVKISPKLGYVNTAIKYITETDKPMRDACYSLLVELSCWMGDLSGVVQAMQDPQKKELASKVEKLGDDEKLRSGATRCYRGEKVIVKAVDASASGREATPAPSNVATLDAYDMVDAVDAQKKLPKGWCSSKVHTMEKWQQKRDHLKELREAIDCVRLAPSDFYSSLTTDLARLLKTESNIPVMTEACKCVGLMARGLRKGYERSAKQLLPIALTRINDKSVWKPHILIASVEQLLWSVPFDFLFDVLREHVASKSLFAKKEAMSLLLRSFDLPQVQLSCADVAQKFFCPLATAVLPNIDDADNTVRQEAARLLALLVHRNPSSPDLDSVVLSKVPIARRNFFDDELRKVGKELGASCDFSTASVGLASAVAEADVEPQSTAAPATAAARSESASARGRIRPASPGAATQPRQQRLASGSPSTRTGVAASRSKLLALTPRSRQPQSDAASTSTVAAAPACAPEVEIATAAPKVMKQSTPKEPPAAARPVLEADAIDDDQTVLIDVMSEEIRRLNAEVTEQKEQLAELAELAQSQPLPTQSSVKPVVHSKTLRPTTPRRLERAQSADRQSGSANPEQQPDRRSIASAREVAKAAPARPSTPTREGRLRRQGSTDAILRRQPSVDSVHISQALLDFKLEPPRQSKMVRQLNQRSQYWGPEQIPPEHLAHLKESFAAVVDAGLFKNMFSERMDELLQALHCWKRQIPVNREKVSEVLDMLLKWLTWMIFNPNTQTWKLTLEVMRCLLEGLATEGGQLTDREAQILVPNIVEKCGHNNQAIRESIMSVLMQCLQVYPRIKVLPMLLHGLMSKNKRSTNGALRAIASCFDRQVAFQLLRTSKDVAAIVKLLDEKDVELKKTALHILALLSLHTDADAFARGCGSRLSKDAQQQVRTAAARLAPATSVGESSMDLSQHAEEVSQVSARPLPTRPESPPKQRGLIAGSALGASSMAAQRPSTPTRQMPGRESTPTRLLTPTKRDEAAVATDGNHRLSMPSRAAVVANVAAEARRYSAPGVPPETMASPASKTPGRHASPLRPQGQSPSGSLRAPRVASPLRRVSAAVAPMATLEAVTPAPAPTSKFLSPMPSPISLRSVSPKPTGHESNSSFNKIMVELSDPCTDARVFKDICDNIRRSIREWRSDSPEGEVMGEMLSNLLPQLIQENFPSEKFKGALQLMDGFSEHPLWKHAVAGKQLIANIVKVFLKLLSKNKDLSKERTGEVNTSFVKCLTNLHPFTAYWALLEVLKEEEKQVSLVLKCLKKVEKKAALSPDKCSEVRAEKEGRGIMEVVLSSRQSVLKLTGTARRQAWLDGARDTVAIARRWLPEVVDECFNSAVAGSTETTDLRLLEELRGTSEGTSSPCSKENVLPVQTAECLPKHIEEKTHSPSAGRTKPRPSSPCVDRNA